jgi:hypothetical protein
MAFAGLRGTGSFGTDERPTNFRELILWLNPNGSAPLFALLARVRKESTDDPQFSGWYELLQNVRVAINYSTGYSTTATTLTIASGGLSLVAGDILQMEGTETTTYANELSAVSSVTSDTVIVVKRGQFGTTPGELTDGQYITKIGNAYMEGASAPDISQRNPTKYYNYTQIFRTAVGQTGTAEAAHYRTGDAWQNDKKRKAFDHSADIEWSFLYGVRSEDTSGTYPKRTTGGLRSFLSTNVTIFGTTPTEDTFLDAVYKVWDYNSNGAGDERIVLAGNGFLNSLNKLARNSSSTQVQFRDVIKLYGMSLQRWILPQGTIGVKTHPLLNIHPRYTNAAFIIDPTGLVYRPLRGRDTKFRDNIQANDADQRKGEWLTEAGLEVRQERTSGYIGNFVV